MSTTHTVAAVTATVRPADPLAPGTYTVRWQVTGADGDLVEQDFRFAIGLALTGDGSAAGGRSTSWTDAALRWLLLLGLAVALGGLVARTHHHHRPTRESVPAGGAVPLVAGALIGLVGVLGLGAALAASAGDVNVWWQSPPGLVVLTDPGRRTGRRSVPRRSSVRPGSGRGWCRVVRRRSTTRRWPGWRHRSCGIRGWVDLGVGGELVGQAPHRVVLGVGQFLGVVTAEEVGAAGGAEEHRAAGEDCVGGAGGVAQDVADVGVGVTGVCMTCNWMGPALMISPSPTARRW